MKFYPTEKSLFDCGGNSRLSGSKQKFQTFFGFRPDKNPNAPRNRLFWLKIIRIVFVAKVGYSSLWQETRYRKTIGVKIEYS
jgi:hypothetical protein